MATGRFGARLTGFFRFYGTKLLRLGAKVGAAARHALSVHRSRTYVQRLWFGVACAGILAWAVVGLGVIPRLVRPPLHLPTPGIEQGDAGVELGSPGGAQAGLPGSAAGLVEEEFTPLAAAPGDRPQAGSGSGPAAPGGGEPGTGAGAEAGGSAQAAAFEPVIPRVPSIPAASVDSMVWPAEGEVTKPFGWHRHPVFNDWRYSPGVAIQPLQEERTVRAALAGRVKDAVNEGGLWRLSVEHDGGWLTEYEGLAEVYVDSLAVVATGEPLGVAAEGLPSGIFFAVRRGGEAVDPVAVARPPVPVAAEGAEGEWR